MVQTPKLFVAPCLVGKVSDEQNMGDRQKVSTFILGSLPWTSSPLAGTATALGKRAIVYGPFQLPSHSQSNPFSSILLTLVLLLPHTTT